MNFKTLYWFPLVCTLRKHFFIFHRPNDIIAQSMAALQELLEHGFISWDQSLNQRFVDKVSFKFKEVRWKNQCNILWLFVLLIKNDADSQNFWANPSIIILLISHYVDITPPQTYIHILIQLWTCYKINVLKTLRLIAGFLLLYHYLYCLKNSCKKKMLLTCIIFWKSNFLNAHYVIDSCIISFTVWHHIVSKIGNFTKFWHNYKQPP